MKVKICKNAKEEIDRVLTDDLSTTDKVKLILLAACIIHTFKTYFDYQQVMHFMGKHITLVISL